MIDERNVIYAGNYKIINKQEAVEGKIFLFFYYNGCETDNINDKEKIAVNDIINYASDVLIDILLREKS